MSANSDLQPMAPLEIAQYLGGPQKLADLVGRTRQTIYNWQVIPAEFVLTIEKASGIPRDRMRPDLWGPHLASPTKRSSQQFPIVP